MITTAAISSLNANWHYLISVPLERVDLLAHYPSAKIVAEGTIDLFDQNSLVVIRNAFYKITEEKWFYLNNHGESVTIPLDCQPLAWRPADIRDAVTRRIIDISRMLKFLNFAGVIETDLDKSDQVLHNTLINEWIHPIEHDPVLSVIRCVQ